MVSVRSFMLQLYYRLQYPGRVLANAQREAHGRAPVMVLAYHRIADDAATPWTQSTASFARQIEWLKQHIDLISFAEAQSRIRSGRNHRAAVSITFDDGYAANSVAAIPLLLREQIPCTYFVTSRSVLEGVPFYHDADLGKPLALNTPAQIREMSDAGIEIGNHSWSHPDFGKIRDVDLLFREVVTSGEELSNLVGRPIRYFAFPFGHHRNMNAGVFRLAKEHGYEAVCSAYGGYNFPGDDAFHLQRIMADSALIRLKNWLTVDPRKLMTIERFEYDVADSPLAVGASP
jgi:peptidoglycan/xylan/chitin deacetylase (PgdA/CDA1 family)